MARIKFVLWERYRAWWGAYQLNEENPFLLDQMKEEQNLKVIKRQRQIKKMEASLKEKEELTRFKVKLLKWETMRPRKKQIKKLRPKILKLDEKRAKEGKRTRLRGKLLKLESKWAKKGRRRKVVVSNSEEGGTDVAVQELNLTKERSS